MKEDDLRQLMKEVEEFLAATADSAVLNERLLHDTEQWQLRGRHAVREADARTEIARAKLRLARIQS